MEIWRLDDEFRLAAGKPMLLYLKRPAPDQEPGLTAMIEGSAAAVSYRHFAAPQGPGMTFSRRPGCVAERELCGGDDQH